MDQSAVSQFVAGFRGLAAVTQPLGPMLLSEFSEAERMRQNVEQRWLMDLRQYRGIYEPEVMARLKNRSKVFSKKTRVKVRAIDDRVFDLEFPVGDERNFEIGPTPEPEIAKPQKAKLIAALIEKIGAEPSAKEIRHAVRVFAEAAAARMTSTISDQLIEAQYRRVAKLAIHSGNLYGTGVIKGPLVDIRLKTRFEHSGESWDVKESEYYLPFIDHVPLWRFFPDMTATDIGDCRYVWERHRLTQAALFDLTKNPSFDGAALLRYAKQPAQSNQRKPYETEVRQIGLHVELGNDGSYELLERWGWISEDQTAGCNLPSPVKGVIFANIWMTPQGEVVKFAPQPIKGQLYPYHLYYFDRDETSIFGEGIATIMRDEQTALNSARRATFDNLAITAGPQIEANADLLDTMSSPTEMAPFSIWWRTGDNGQFPAVRIINAESHVNELSSVAGMCDNEIDEVTGIPKYLYGDGPKSGAGATSSGLSQLMGQANVSVKAQVQEFDDGVTTPLIQGLVAWNMQFNSDPSIKGDYKVQATGTRSLVAKEVRSQMLAQFTGSLTEAELQYIKFDKLVAEKAKAHDLGDILKTKEEVEQELNNPATQMQMQMQQAQAQLQMAQMEANVGKLQAEMARITANAEYLKAQALRSKVDSQYAAMQAGAVVATNQHVAPIGDAILREAGWVDAANDGPGDAVAQSAEGVPIPEQPMPPQGTNESPSPFVGETAGIETAAVPQ